MSQKTSRKGVVSEEKEKTDTPVKEMKKKMAANAEKEKEKDKQNTDKKEVEKPAEKPTDKSEKAADKIEKAADKKTDKAEKKTEKPVEKKAEKPVEKKPEAEKKEESSKEDKSAKQPTTETNKPDTKKADAKPKQNGNARQNGTPAPSTNGTEDHGTVSEDDDDAMVIDEHDEMFPELAYDDTSDAEFEPPTPEASRSYTRRSQAKATRTPETPRPASDKQASEHAGEDSKDSKVLKLKEEAPPATDRKLRSSDSPKPQDKKAQEKQDKAQESKKVSESPKEQESKDDKQEGEANDQEGKENGEKQDKPEPDVVVIDVDGNEDEPRKTDTNYSKSRVKVSPYRRSMRIADQTTSSVMANYTGNNTTMEMDITETSSFASDDASLDDSSYLSGLRAIRGRRSYKQLKELNLRHNKPRPKPAVLPASGEQSSRPMAPVVGRKRKPEGSESSVEVAVEAGESYLGGGKRARLLARLAGGFRRAPAVSTPLPHRRAPEIVGINTDLPLTAPVAQPDTFDPEALKTDAPIAVPLAQPVSAEGDRDNKRCVVM